MKEDFAVLNKALPKNQGLPKDKYHDLILRELDCAVIEYMHQKIAEKIEADTSINGFRRLTAFRSARGIFTEGRTCV
jgi:hypothetical protein